MTTAHEVAGPTGIENPYVGPRSVPFGKHLYGRSREIAHLRQVLISQRIVLLYSPSGAGKSSLLEAGLRPELVKNRFRVMPTVRVGHEAPPSLSGMARRNRYVLSVLLSLEEGRPAGEQLGADELATITIDEYLARTVTLSDAERHPCLLIDQFEELFTLDPTDQHEKEAFLAELGVALRERSRWALIAMREDFIAQLDPYLALFPNGLGARFRLDLLGPEAAKEAIRMPAEEAGVAFSDAAAEKLVKDLREVRVQRGGQAVPEDGPYVEPVQLQVVCRQLWSAVIG